MGMSGPVPPLVLPGLFPLCLLSASSAPSPLAFLFLHIASPGRLGAWPFPTSWLLAPGAASALSACLSGKAATALPPWCPRTTLTLSRTRMFSVPLVIQHTFLSTVSQRRGRQRHSLRSVASPPSCLLQSKCSISICLLAMDQIKEP